MGEMDRHMYLMSDVGIYSAASRRTDTSNLFSIGVGPVGPFAFFFFGRPQQLDSRPQREPHATPGRPHTAHKMDASRGRPVGERKSLTLDERRKERRASSDRRKSGPKAVLASLEGKEGRRRLSANHRRTSRSNKAAALRRERGQPRPPLVGHRGIGRASLPARLPPPTAAAVVAGKEAHDGVVAMVEQEEQEVVVEKLEKTEGTGDGGGHEGSWTPERVAEAVKAILSDDRQSQLRYCCTTSTRLIN